MAYGTLFFGFVGPPRSEHHQHHQWLISSSSRASKTCALFSHGKWCLGWMEKKIEIISVYDILRWETLLSLSFFFASRHLHISSRPISIRTRKNDIIISLLIFSLGADINFCTHNSHSRQSSHPLDEEKRRVGWTIGRVIIHSCV